MAWDLIRFTSGSRVLIRIRCSAPNLPNDGDRVNLELARCTALAVKVPFPMLLQSISYLRKNNSLNHVPSPTKHDQSQQAIEMIPLSFQLVLFVGMFMTGHSNKQDKLKRQRDHFNRPKTVPLCKDLLYHRKEHQGPKSNANDRSGSGCQSGKFSENHWAQRPFMTDSHFCHTIEDDPSKWENESKQKESIDMEQIPDEGGQAFSVSKLLLMWHWQKVEHRNLHAFFLPTTGVMQLRPPLPGMARWIFCNVDSRPVPRIRPSSSSSHAQSIAARAPHPGLSKWRKVPVVSSRRRSAWAWRQRRRSQHPGKGCAGRK